MTQVCITDYLFQHGKRPLWHLGSPDTRFYVIKFVCAYFSCQETLGVTATSLLVIFRPIGVSGVVKPGSKQQHGHIAVAQLETFAKYSGGSHRLSCMLWVMKEVFFRKIPG
jgi:hypothetical protein